MVHDIGVAIGYDSHHLHSSYIVLNSLLPGYTPRERMLVALLTRYHRNRGTPKAGEFSSVLEAGDEHALTVLSGILRICEYLERGRRHRGRDVRATLTSSTGGCRSRRWPTGMRGWSCGTREGT